MSLFHRVLVSIFTMATAAIPAAAHHSSAYFDMEAEIVHENVTVVGFRVANPHGVLVYVVTDEDGTEVQWESELPSANFTRRGGITGSTLSPGDILPTVVGWPGVPGSTREHFTRLKTMTLTNGDVAAFTAVSATLTPAETQ